jgi:prolyl oligopeptidase
LLSWLPPRERRRDNLIGSVMNPTNSYALIDMRRYTRLLAGASWIAEYGDPDKPEDWAFLGELSAYHTAQPGRAYPPILLATTRRDDRVHPGHARKMAAKLRAMGYDALFYEPSAGGHGYGKDNAEIASFAALGMRFLRRSIGWGDGPD